MEYQLQARTCAQALEARKNDPLMIGYFLRNEPAWAFVDNLVIADEVLHNPAGTACKDVLIESLQERYQTIEALNRAWNSSLEGFHSLYEPQEKVSKWSVAAHEDMKEFSRRMLRAYVEIPVRECRRVDPNHMILGMRWAWISDPDLVTGWENFDVFSINCYAEDPTEKIQHIVDLGVDLPVMIGEFHFGALDAGLPAFSYRDYYLKFEELPAGDGYADIVYLPKKDSPLPALVVELKWNRAAKGAIGQIKERRCPDAIRDYGGELLLVGISYEKSAPEGKRKHSCVIEKLGKSAWKERR